MGMMASGSGSRSSTDGSNFIVISVKDQNDREMFFRVKNSAKLTKLMDIYCEKRGLKPKTVQFIYNHRRITRRHTPAGLQMKDGDEIDAMLHFNGGGYKASKHEEI